MREELLNYLTKHMSRFEQTEQSLFQRLVPHAVAHELSPGHPVFLHLDKLLAMQPGDELDGKRIRVTVSVVD